METKDLLTDWLWGIGRRGVGCLQKIDSPLSEKTVGGAD